MSLVVSCCCLFVSGWVVGLFGCQFFSLAFCVLGEQRGVFGVTCDMVLEVGIVCMLVGFYEVSRNYLAFEEDCECRFRWRAAETPDSVSARAMVPVSELELELLCCRFDR